MKQVQAGRGGMRGEGEEEEEGEGRGVGPSENHSGRGWVPGLTTGGEWVWSCIYVLYSGELSLGEILSIWPTTTKMSFCRFN